MTQQINLSQAHGVQEVTDGGCMLRHARSRGRGIGLPESWQIGGKYRAANPGDRQEAHENVP
jgi:hypothetical protein